MPFTVKINSRGFDPEKIIAQVRTKAFDRVLTDAQENTRFMRCPDHGRSADLSMQDADTDKASLEIRACCDAFRKKVLEAVKRR